MIWPLLALCTSTACSESAATAPDATSVVMPSRVVLESDRQVMSVGTKAKAQLFLRRGGAAVPVEGWQVITGSDVVSIDRNGLLVANSSGEATIAARIGRDTWTMPVEVIPHRDGTPGQRIRPHLPEVILDFPFPAVTGRSIRVDAGDNLQSALDKARRGDEVVLAAGATWVGNFSLPALGGSVADGWVTIRGEQSGRLPPLGSRVSPDDALLMPKVVTPDSRAALRTDPAASGWRMVGLEVTVLPTFTQQQYGLVWLGDGSKTQSTLASVPTDIVLDRMYIHGQTNTNMSRCVALNSARTQISDSYLDECHGKGFDSQAILGWNGPGPFKIVNNALMGAGENIMFGGADPSIPDLVPSDIEIRRNYVYTPVAWKGVWTKKNILELKNAARVLIEGNVFEGSWVDAQTGTAIMFRSANQSNACRWCRTTDVTFRRNYVANAAGGITFIGGKGGYPVDTTARRILVSESVFENIGVSPYTGEQRGFQFNEAPEDVTIDQTILTGTLNLLMYIDRDNPAQRVSFNRSVFVKNTIMVNGITQADQAMPVGMPGYSWQNMYLIGSTSTGYPTGTNFAPAESGTPNAAQIRSTVTSATAGVRIP